ncbi:MAG: hypothetical protein AAF827_05995 [Cyanobacteria bacterium P01_D01_bin.6]
MRIARYLEAQKPVTAMLSIIRTDQPLPGNPLESPQLTTVADPHD